MCDCFYCTRVISWTSCLNVNITNEQHRLTTRKEKRGRGLSNGGCFSNKPPVDRQRPCCRLLVALLSELLVQYVGAFILVSKGLPPVIVLVLVFVWLTDNIAIYK